MTKPSRRDATRAQLVEAAVGVLAARGVQGATIEEVCEAAGFTRGAFYSNFASREELYVAVLERRSEAYLSAVRGAVAGLGSDVDLARRVDHAAQQFLAAAGEDRDTVLVLTELRLHAVREPAVRDALERLDQRVEPLLASLVEQGLAANGLRLTLPLDDAITLLHAVYDQAALAELSRGRRPDSPEVARVLALAMGTMIVAA